MLGKSGAPFAVSNASHACQAGSTEWRAKYPNPAIAQCQALLPFLPASNRGECLSYITVANNESEGEVSHHCDALEENDPITFDFFFVTRSECIQAFGGRGHFN